MTGFAASVEQWAHNAVRDVNAVFVSTNVEINRSIKFGSELTGASAMPVAIPKYFKAGALRDSVTLRYLDPNTALHFTTKWYAPNVENNTENHKFVSGGPHGWKMTQAAFPRIVEHVAKRITGGGK